MPNFTHALLYVRPFRDNVVKFMASGEPDREVERSIDSLAFAKMNDDKCDNVDYDEVCDVINAVISELDGRIIDDTGYLWAPLTETLVEKIVSAFETLPSELRVCDAERVRDWLKKYVGLEILVEFAHID
jgi:hypothetical protein